MTYIIEKDDYKSACDNGKKGRSGREKNVDQNRMRPTDGTWYKDDGRRKRWAWRVQSVRLRLEESEVK